MSRRALIALAALAALSAALAGWLGWWSRAEPRGDGAPPGARPCAAPSPTADARPRPVGAAPPLVPARRTPADAPREQATWSAPLELALRDARSGQGLPFVRVSIRQETPFAEERASTDAEGRLRSRQAFAAGALQLAARDELSDEGLGRTAVEHGPAPGEWRVAVGPTFGLAVDASALPPGEHALEARLRERGPLGEGRDWSWRPLAAPAGEPLRWLRYARVEHEPAQGWTARLEVRAQGAPFCGEVPAPATVGVHRLGPLTLCARAGGLRGRVVDTAGAPVDARVVLFGGRPQDPDRGGADADWLDQTTDEAGAFAWDAVEPGVHRLLVSSTLGLIERADVEVAAGQVTVRDFVLAAALPAGDVRGALLSRPGAGEPLALVQLEAADGRALTRVALAGLDLWGDPDGDERSAFAFADLPAGRYRVSVASLDGRRYSPAERLVEVPAGGLEFATEQSLQDTMATFVITVTDAESGARVPSAAMLLRIGDFWLSEIQVIEDGLWREEAPRSEAFELVVCAPGYLPQRLRLDAAVPVGPELELCAQLQPGCGAALLVLDAEDAASAGAEAFGEVFPARGVPGAVVLVAGRAAGSVAPDGLALVAARDPIEDLRVVAPGWIALAVQRFRGHARTPDGIGFVLMARE